MKLMGLLWSLFVVGISIRLLVYWIVQVRLLLREVRPEGPGGPRGHGSYSSSSLICIIRAAGAWRPPLFID